MKEQKTESGVNRKDSETIFVGPLQEAKQRIYMAATTPGVILLMILWFVSYTFGEMGLIDQYTVPLLSTIIVILLIMLRLQRIKLNTFEIFVFCLVFVYFLTKIYLDFNRLAQEGDRINSSTLLCIPLLYILGFTLLGKRKGFISALIFLISLMYLGMASLYQSRGIPGNIDNVLMLMELLLVSIASIVMLYLLSYISEQHFKGHVQAEVNARLANTDSLTQVNNRRQLEKHIENEIKRANRYSQPLAVLMLDFDYFKKVNDQYGHTAGDAVLVNIAQRVRGSLRSIDHFGRWGGDEFICVAVNTDIDTANALAERLRKEIEEARFPDTPVITCSIGVTLYLKGDTLNKLISRVDKGLMQSKAAGRNRVVCVLTGDEPLG